MQAIQAALPPSFAGLLLGLATFMLIEPNESLQIRFSHSFAPGLGVMSALLCVLLTLQLAKRRDVPRLPALAVAEPVFLLSLPYQHASSFASLARALGSSGLFLAMGVALVSVTALRLARAKLGPLGGSLLAGTAVVGGAVLLLATGVSLTNILDRMIAPLGDLGDSLTALLIITMVETLLWAIGIHGPALLAAVVFPVYLSLQTQNAEALAHGRPLPHIVTVSLFLFVFPGGAGATLPLVLLLLRSRIARLHRVALATLVPAVFNVNEPLMFGLPLVVNPLLGVPFVLAPLALCVITFLAVNFGWVARPAFYMPSMLPLPVSVFLATKDWRAVVLALVNVAVAAAIYAPFVALYERQEKAREHERAAA